MDVVPDWFNTYSSLVYACSAQIDSSLYTSAPILVKIVPIVERTETNGEAKRLKRAIDFALHIIYYKSGPCTIVATNM